MDSLCKYPVSPVNAVLVAGGGSSLLKVPSDESIWPQSNCVTPNIEHVYQPESEINSNEIATNKYGFGFSELKHIRDVPSKLQNSIFTISGSCENTSSDVSLYIGSSDNGSVSGETTRVCDEVSGVKAGSSGFHHMILRPKLTSPRHCIITLYDDSENEESTDSDYSVDLDECDSTSSDEETDSSDGLASSDEDSSDSERDAPAKENEMTHSSEELSDEESSECSGSDEDEVDPPITDSFSDEETAESSGDEDTDNSSKSAHSDEETAESSDDENETAHSSKSSDSEEETAESSEEETAPPTKPSNSDEGTAESSSDEETAPPTKSPNSGEETAESSSGDEDEVALPTRKSSDSARGTSFVTEDSDNSNVGETSVTKLNDCDKKKKTSKRKTSTNEELNYSDSPLESSPTTSELEDESTDDDKSIDLGESTEYSSERDQSD